MQIFDFFVKSFPLNKYTAGTAGCGCYTIAIQPQFAWHSG